MTVELVYAASQEADRGAFFTESDVISTYSRADAIADGVLIDVTDSAEWREAGFKFPVAMTREVWSYMVEWTDKDGEAQRVHQDQTGRLWDVLYMLHMAIKMKGPQGGSHIEYELYCVPRDGSSSSARLFRLVAEVGPGDNLEPVITIKFGCELSSEESDEQDNDQTEQVDSGVIPLTQFIRDFGEGLLEAVQHQNPPIYDGIENTERSRVMNQLKRRPFDAQRHVVQAVARLLLDEGERAAVINAEMGTGKTMMAICASQVFYHEGHKRFLVLAPPHLVYKWRREILETVDNARVWVLNGPDTLMKLLAMRQALGSESSSGPEYFILGRVRMRMGFHWRPAFAVRKRHLMVRINESDPDSETIANTVRYVACPCCGEPVYNQDGERILPEAFGDDRRRSCGQCGEPLWTLMRPGVRKSQRELVRDAMCQIPTIGPKTADNLLRLFGENLLGNMLADNLYEFINLMDEEGELVFSDKQAKRMERSMANLELSFGQGGYQPTEFIKRYLPKGYFDLLICDEGHEYKNADSAQGQAMGVLVSQIPKTILLTGTLMAGYADDLFYLLWRIMPERMIEEGLRYNERGSLGSACMAFMREHGVLKDVYKETESDSHRTAKGKRITVRTTKAPGFGPKGIAQFVLPFTAFLKLRDIGQDVLPSYDEQFIEVPMTDDQGFQYKKLQGKLQAELRQALARGDSTLLGVVLNVLLAWPDCAFREEVVKHPRTGSLLHFVGKVFDENNPSPKEMELVRICRAEKAKGRRVLAYTVYTGKRDTATRLVRVLKEHGLRAAVLRSSVATEKREDWIMEQVDRGIDVLICNPELVKTGLDLLDFPTLVYMQTGYNVYTTQQASRRSWRIGQTQPVKVLFLGYAETAQITCLSLMARKIAVSQSTSGDMPDTGLDVLNQEGESIEVELARELLAKAA